MTIYKHTSITATLYQRRPASRFGTVHFEVRDIRNNVVVFRKARFFTHIQSEATFENNFIAEYQTQLDEYNFLTAAHRDPADCGVVKDLLFTLA